MDCFSRPNKSKKMTDAQKGRIISLRFENHQSLENIARLADCSVKTVQKWIDRYERDQNVERKFGPGRPRTTTNEQNIGMVEYLEANPFSSTVRAAALQNVPYRTALRRVHESGLGNYNAAHQTKLTDQHKQQRIDYCRSMLDVFGEQNYQKIIFTDEKTFQSDKSHHVYWMLCMIVCARILGELCVLFLFSFCSDILMRYGLNRARKKKRDFTSFICILETAHASNSAFVLLALTANHNTIKLRW